MKDYNYQVDKYVYETPLMIEEAKKEEEAIAYMRKNADFGRIDHVCQLYNKLNQKPSFQTEVGMEFMRELYEIIAESGRITRENIPPIKVKSSNPFQLKHPMTKEELLRETKAEEKVHQLKQKIKNLWIINIFFIGMIGIMFYISRHGDYSHINDYRTQILNEYASWEENLRQREQAIIEQERKLGISKE